MALTQRSDDKHLGQVTNTVCHYFPVYHSNTWIVKKELKKTLKLRGSVRGQDSNLMAVGGKEVKNFMVEKVY